MKTRNDVDLLVDRFVSAVNRLPRRKIREEDIPLRLRQGRAEFGLYYGWRIQSFRYINWIRPLERKIGCRLPPSYRSLVTRYIFPSFEWAPLILLANTGQALYNEVSTAIFHDRVMSKTLLKNGFAQFARPSSGDVDPVCFDLNRRTKQGEYPIVRIDHERLLLNSVPEIMEEIAPSFRMILEEATSSRRQRRSNATAPD